MHEGNNKIFKDSQSPKKFLRIFWLPLVSLKWKQQMVKNKIFFLMENQEEVVMAASQIPLMKCLILISTGHHLVAKQLLKGIPNCRESKGIGQENGFGVKMFEESTRFCLHSIHHGTNVLLKVAFTPKMNE